MRRWTGSSCAAGRASSAWHREQHERQQPSHERQLYIGVDGGGTGCRARVEDAEGDVLGSGICGACRD